MPPGVVPQSIMADDDEENAWKPFPFRRHDIIPLPLPPGWPPRGSRRDPAALVLRLLDEAMRGSGIGFVPVEGFAALGDAVMRCESGDLDGSLRAANRLAEEKPALRPLALIVARMCVHKELDRLRAALVG